MSNWRTIIKTFFADKVAEALGSNLKKFGPWNNQLINTGTEETFNDLAIFFEYSLVGDGLEYLRQINVDQAERVPVEVTLHIVFNKYTEVYQDTAYDYADKISQAIVGQKHPCISGRIMKTNEREDGNHAANYDYQISFGFQLQEVYLSMGADLLEDANPETTTNPNPDTGRRLKTRIRIGEGSNLDISIFTLDQVDKDNVTLDGTGSMFDDLPVGGTQGMHKWIFELGPTSIEIKGNSIDTLSVVHMALMDTIGMVNASGVYANFTFEKNGNKDFGLIGDISITHTYDGNLNNIFSDPTFDTILTAAFISEWDTRNLTTGSTPNNQIKLPLYAAGIYDFSIDWGDGNIESITDENALHTYTTPDEYEIRILGTIKGFSFGNADDRGKILDLTNWGSIEIGAITAQFSGCSNLTKITAPDTPILPPGTGVTFMFRFAVQLAEITNIANWDISQLTRFVGTFQQTLFNGDISGWDMSNITNIDSMLRQTPFDQDISNWDIENVTSAVSFLRDTSNFSTVNYDLLLVGWNDQNVNMSVSSHFGNSKYTGGSPAEAARDNLVNVELWTIIDGGAV